MPTAAYDRGLTAFQQDQPTNSCEHPGGSHQGREWLRGWTDGQISQRLKLKDTPPQ